MTTTTIKQAIAKSAEGYPLLGWIIYWSTSQFREDVSKVKAVLAEVGIDEEYARLIAPSTALQAAFDKSVTGQNMKKMTVRPTDDSSKTIITLIRGSAAGMEVDVDSITRGWLVNDDAMIVGEFADEIRSEFHVRKSTYTNTQFVSLVKDYISAEASSLTLRDHGGVYFIPAHKETEFKKLLALFSAFSSASIDVVPVIDTQQAKRSVWSALTADIEAELASLQTQLDGWEKDGDPRDGVIQRRLEQYASLKEKVEDYSVLLSGAANELQEKLDTVAKKLREKL